MQMDGMAMVMFERFSKNASLSVLGWCDNNWTPVLAIFRTKRMIDDRFLKIHCVQTEEGLRSMPNVQLCETPENSVKIYVETWRDLPGRTWKWAIPKRGPP